MKISREQVTVNRGRILEAAIRLFRERGFEGVTVAQVMGAAGLTHGAFYGYFTSKQDLVAQSLAHALTRRPGEAGDIDVMKFAASYLTPAHRDDLGGGCLFAALGTEAVRSSDETRRAMTASVRSQIEMLSRSAQGRNPAERRQAATGSWAAMIGALMLARLVDDEQLSDQLMTDTRRWLGSRSTAAS